MAKRRKSANGDRHLAGACGAYCGACLAYRAELSAEAARLRDRIRRQGFLALARRLDPAERGRIDAFFEVLDRVARLPACPGCGRGGGEDGCPVRACAAGRGHATCAACGDLAPCAAGDLRPSRRGTPRHEREGTRGAPRAFPFTASQYLARVSRKHAGWNLENLEAIRARGLAAWLSAMARDAGFRSIEVKVDEDVWGDD
jgi:hypothetical protein